MDFLSRLRQDFLYFHECEASLTSEINSIFNAKNIDFSVNNIFFGFRKCFFQISDTTCYTWCDVTIACYFHIMKITILIFSHCENNSLWRYSFQCTDKLGISQLKCNKCSLICLICNLHQSDDHSTFGIELDHILKVLL